MKHYNWKMIEITCCICGKKATVRGNKKADTPRTCSNRPCQIKRANLKKAELYRSRKTGGITYKPRAKKPTPKRVSIYEFSPLQAGRLPEAKFLKWCEGVLGK